MTILRISLLCMGLLLGYASPATAQTIKEIMGGMDIIATNGICTILQKRLSCDIGKKDGKEYFIIYSEDNLLSLIIRREDNKVIWTTTSEI